MLVEENLIWVITKYTALLEKMAVVFMQEKVSTFLLMKLCFSVILIQAITVAAKDYTSHLKLRRDQITCMLYHYCCPCNEIERSVPLEEMNVSQPNADTKSTDCRMYCVRDGHQDKTKRVDHVDFNLYVEHDKSFTVECNTENKMDMPSNIEDGCNKETGGVGNEDSNQGLKLQDQILLLTLAENTSIKQNGNSGLGTNGASFRKEDSFLESLDVNTICNLQDDLNKNTTIEGSRRSKSVYFNGFVYDKDSGSLKNLSKIIADQNGGAKEVSLDNTLNDTHVDRHEGDNVVGGEANLLRIGGSQCEQTTVWKDLINSGEATTTHVFEIRRILEDFHNQSDMMLLALLMKLKSMDLDFKILKVTLIGRAVNALRKHAMKEIRKATCSLIRDWRTKVDQWMEEQHGRKLFSLQKDKQPPPDKTELAIFDDSNKQVKKKDSKTKLGNRFNFTRTPKCDNGNTIGGRREKSLVVSLNVASNSQLKTKRSTEDRNPSSTNRPINLSINHRLNPISGVVFKRPEKLRISQTNELKRVTETRRKLGEACRNVQVEKQHTTQTLDVNHDLLSQQVKHHKHHHARTE